MSKSKIKVRSKKRIRTDLLTEVERDGEKRNELRAMLRAIVDFCDKNDIEPETLLTELVPVRSVAVRVYMKKHQKQIASGLDRDPTSKEIKRMRKDFGRALAQMSKFNADRPLKKKARGNGNGSKPKPERRSNEDMPYQGSKDRPNYIN